MVFTSAKRNAFTTNLLPERNSMQKKEINVNEIEKKIGYVFKDKSLLIQAFTRTSFCNENVPSAKMKYQSNEVLEFFGDGVLSVAIISFLLKECTERYAYGIKTDLDEGDFSNIKSKLSDKQNLSKSMKSLGLQKHLRMGEGDAKLGIENEPSVMEDLFESIVGAIYIDSDMSIDAVIRSVSFMLDMSVYTDRQKPIQSAKNALQEWCADKKRRLPPPKYVTLSEDGPDHKKTYMRGCYIGDRLAGRGIGKNFKLADAAAAEDALKTLMAENNSVLQTKIVKNAKTADTPASIDSSNLSGANQKNDAKQSEKTVELAKPAPSPLSILKAYASSQKKPTAVFKDLGEIKRAGVTVCRVECAFLEETTAGEGRTRSEARDNSAALMIDKIGIGKKKKTKPNTAVNKHEVKKKTTKAKKLPQTESVNKIETAKKASSARRNPQSSKKSRRNSSATSHKKQ